MPGTAPNISPHWTAHRRRPRETGTTLSLNEPGQQWRELKILRVKYQGYLLLSNRHQVADLLQHRAIAAWRAP